MADRDDRPVEETEDQSASERAQLTYGLLAIFAPVVWVFMVFIRAVRAAERAEAASAPRINVLAALLWHPWQVRVITIVVAVLLIVALWRPVAGWFGPIEYQKGGSASPALAFVARSGLS